MNRVGMDNLLLMKSKTKVYKTVEDVLNCSFANHIYKGLMENIAFSSADKKQMRKQIIKTYINILDEYAENVFDSLGVIAPNLKDLQKVVLFIKYNTDRNISEIIKEIKKMNCFTMENLAFWGYEIEKIRSNFEWDEQNGKYEDRGEDNVIGSSSSCLSGINILDSTIEMIKGVKYDNFAYSIKHFDEDGNIKKVFTNKFFVKEARFFNYSLRCIDENRFTINDVANHINHSYILEGDYEFTLSKICEIMYEFTLKQKYNFKISEDEYTKLILGEEYSKLINNRVDNPIDVIRVDLSNSVFVNRKILIPKNGVLLLVKDNENIESILIKEIFKYDINHIVIITKYKSGKELTNILPMSSFEEMYLPFWSSKWEPKNELKSTIAYVTSFFIDKKIDDDIEYEVISPTYWKYRSRGYKSENDEVNLKGVVVKREFEIEIAPFLRKINGTPGKEALNLARKLGLKLEDGYTIVKPHTRTYNSVDKVNSKGIEKK